MDEQTALPEREREGGKRSCNDNGERIALLE